MIRSAETELLLSAYLSRSQQSIMCASARFIRNTNENVFKCVPCMKLCKRCQPKNDVLPGCQILIWCMAAALRRWQQQAKQERWQRRRNCWTNCLTLRHQRGKARSSLKPKAPSLRRGLNYYIFSYLPAVFTFYRNSAWERRYMLPSEKPTI